MLRYLVLKYCDPGLGYAGEMPDSNLTRLDNWRPAHAAEEREAPRYSSVRTHKSIASEHFGC
jgi:hypothetical protein